MREVIQGLIEAEREACDMVRSARAEAVGLEAGAGKRSQELLARAREKARDEAAGVIEIAVAAAQQEKARRLEEAGVEITSRVRMDESLRTQLVDAAVRCIAVQS